MTVVIIAFIVDVQILSRLDAQTHSETLTEELRKALPPYRHGRPT